jgi:hypothetical protein
VSDVSWRGRGERLLCPLHLPASSRDLSHMDEVSGPFGVGPSDAGVVGVEVGEQSEADGAETLRFRFVLECY